MKFLILLGIICGIYYFVLKKYPLMISYKNSIYFYIFVGCYIVLYYLMTYQKGFVYKAFHFMRDIDEKPLYEIKNKNNEYLNQLTFKNNIALKQGNRCFGCQNLILNKDIDNYNIQFINNPEKGGSYTLDNVCLKCPRCSTFNNLF